MSSLCNTTPITTHPTSQLCISTFSHRPVYIPRLVRQIGIYQIVPVPASETIPSVTPYLVRQVGRYL